MTEHSSRDDEDRELLRALQSSDDVDGPFRELYRRYRRRLLAFFSRRGFSRETCSDLIQDTLVRVYKGRGGFRGDVPLASWIFQIAANVAKNELRWRGAGKRRGVEKSLDDEDEDQPLEVHFGGNPLSTTAEAEPLARTMAREQVEALREALEGLPEKMRRIMQLSIHHEYSVSQIAIVMKITESTVKVQLHNGRKRLRRALTDRFGDLPF